MSKSTQNRRQFITTSGKAGIALAAMPLMAKINSPSSTFMAANEYAQQPLNYGYAALEPFIDAMTMEIHYTKHAAAYAKNLVISKAIQSVVSPEHLEGIILVFFLADK